MGYKYSCLFSAKKMYEIKLFFEQLYEQQVYKIEFIYRTILLLDNCVKPFLFPNIRIGRYYSLFFNHVFSFHNNYLFCGRETINDQMINSRIKIKNLIFKFCIFNEINKLITDIVGVEGFSDFKKVLFQKIGSLHHLFFNLLL